MDGVLVAPPHDYLYVVMVTRLFAKPEIDRPASCDRPPEPDAPHDVSDRFWAVHGDIVAPSESTERQIGSVQSSPRTATSASSTDHISATVSLPTRRPSR